MSFSFIEVFTLQGRCGHDIGRANPRSCVVCEGSPKLMAPGLSKASLHILMNESLVAQWEPRGGPGGDGSLQLCGGLIFSLGSCGGGDHPPAELSFCFLPLSQAQRGTGAGEWGWGPQEGQRELGCRHSTGHLFQ